MCRRDALPSRMADTKLLCLSPAALMWPEQCRLYQDAGALCRRHRLSCTLRPIQGEVSLCSCSVRLRSPGMSFSLRMPGSSEGVQVRTPAASGAQSIFLFSQLPGVPCSVDTWIGARTQKHSQGGIRLSPRPMQLCPPGACASWAVDAGIGVRAQKRTQAGIRFPPQPMQFCSQGMRFPGCERLQIAQIEIMLLPG